jgi:hypothetical protein
MVEHVDPAALEQVYLTNLENSIMSKLADRLAVDPREAMDIYYRSELAKQIAAGSFGIQYLDPEYLIDDLLVNELELTNR